MSDGCTDCGWFYLGLCETYDDGTCAIDKEESMEASE